MTELENIDFEELYWAIKRNHTDMYMNTFSKKALIELVEKRSLSKAFLAEEVIAIWIKIGLIKYDYNDFNDTSYRWTR